MTLPVTLNPFPNPVPGMDLPATILNVRGQDNAIADTLNAVILALGGGGLPLSVPAANVTAGTFGAGDFIFQRKLTAGAFVSSGTIGVSPGTAAFFYDATDGTVINTQAGSASQLVVQNSTGQSILTVPLGTHDAEFGGALSSVGDFSVATSKFTVDHTTGNTLIAGTLGVTGALGASNFSGTSSGTNTGDQTSAGCGNAQERPRNSRPREISGARVSTVRRRSAGHSRGSRTFLP